MCQLKGKRMYLVQLHIIDEVTLEWDCTSQVTSLKGPGGA